MGARRGRVDDAAPGPRRRPIRLVVALALAVILVSAVSPAAADARTVRVGVYQNKPKVFMDRDGRAAGLFIELLSEIAAAEGWTLQFVPCAWAACLGDLRAGGIDLMPDVAHTQDREQIYDFHHTPVLESWSQFYARPNASISALSDLVGKRVAVLGNSVQQDAFETLMAGFGFEVTIVPTESLEAAFQAVREGTADVAIANHFFGDYFHRDYGLVQTAIVFQPAQLFFATADGRNLDLLEAVDRHLEAWHREPNSVYYTTLGRWMERPPVRLVPRRVLWIIGIAVGMLVVAGALILVLRLQVRAKTRHLVRANEELRRAEVTLRDSEALLNSAQHLGRMGGWEWDLDKQMATWTEETYRIHDVAPEGRARGAPDLMERSFACYEREARATVRAAFERCCEHGEGFELEAPFRTESGQRLWVRTNAEAVRDAEERVVKVVGNIMDVTDARAAEEERRSLEGQLRHAQKMEAFGRLAGGIAHDFNNLLTVILSYTELSLQQLQSDGSVRDNLAEVLGAGQRAAGLTSQLLAFSRKQVLELVPVDLNQSATGLERMLRRIIGEDIDLKLSLAPDLGVTLADRGQIEQVIMNLVINARDAMPAGGALTIATANVDLDQADAAKWVGATPGPFVMLSVSDSGSGMDEATRSRIFEPFFTTKEPGEGTGLGLSTVYGIVTQLGGHIQLESEPERGTTFRIYSPRQTSAPAVTSPAAPPASRSSGSETVLVVEDDRAVRDLAARILQSAGYTVLVAATPADAVETCEKRPDAIHLLLTDVVMPGMNGESLAARLASVRPSMKILYMSSYPDGLGDHRPGVGFIGKPFAIDELTGKVRQTLDSR